MTDLEMTKLCAEAMGTPPWVVGDQYPDSEWFWPLRHDAQAMALVKKFKINVIWYEVNVSSGGFEPTVYMWSRDDLNRAIVECVAEFTKPSS
jgi:hypothetical protein